MALVGVMLIPEDSVVVPAVVPVVGPVVTVVTEGSGGLLQRSLWQHTASQFLIWVSVPLRLVAKSPQIRFLNSVHLDLIPQSWR